MFKNKIKCEECKHYIDKVDAQKVKYCGIFTDWTIFFCPMHKKPYNEISVGTFSNKYYGRIEMQEDGTPVGYKKK